MKKLLLLGLLILSLPLVSCGQHSVVTEPVYTLEPEESPVSDYSPTANPHNISEPVEFFVSLFESNNDEQRLYIKTEYIDPFQFETGTLERTISESIYIEMDEYIEWIRKSSMEYPATADNLVSYGLTSFLEITQNDSNFLSMYIDYYTYTGGAHGNLTRMPFVYDREGNKYENLEDILSPETTIADVEVEINKQMKKIIEENGPMFYKDTFAFEDLYTPPYFYIKDNILVIYFQTYEIAPHAAGIQEFPMPAGFLRIPNSN